MALRSYETLFFDLDHTLWDFHTNSTTVLKEIFTETGLHLKGLEFEEFYTVYNRVNDQKWALYREGKIDKYRLRKERFADTLAHFQIQEVHLGNYFEQQYVERSPQQTALMPGALEALNYLYEKYQLAIITNGFTSVQLVKLKSSGLDKYFKEIVTSEMAGANKPEAKIFVTALKKTQSKREETIMIGDHLEADIAGARNVGIDQIWYNPEGQKSDVKPTYEIDNLTALISLL
ncbi:noncanonical pyrimidine nucleotidase, YjjG family protein [Thermaurantimonas aggregans]|uniref:Noncanonical pyrimidine nucleotidase, YjjG family protein n=1 Tax=Thermaurantimonas aggregans TaxID=2173829 RepID=A0A401XIV6_9FLAO|nr:YjjG family noncanonical pyrimidine nucleotidase [Thermaurantimonas aggregans]MCX8149796.1 YjjG family noncanonical pyrimidine nucleotidase [Thermaurantimonas aggregans]GCD76923.1 noncanonical pyrimidine nucleotidase, YjjG family protein [Thermaurantimonas aggregans]